MTAVDAPTRSSLNAMRHVTLAAWLLMLLMPSAARAQDATSDPRLLLAPISDVLSASSWLWASGLDPRDPFGSPSFVAAFGAIATTDASSETDPQDVRVTKQVGLTPVSAEPALAVDPGDPRRVVLAVSALDLPSPAVYVSEDGGERWDGPIQVPVPVPAGHGRSIGAPVIAFDRHGVLYLAAQTASIDALAESALPLSVIQSRISVARSDDGGRTWQSVAMAVQGETNLGLAPDASGVLSGGLSIGFLDSLSLVVAPNPRRPDSDALTLSYTEFLTRYNVTQSPTGVDLVPNDASSTIRIVQSLDAGATWSSPASVSPSAMRGLAPPPTAAPPPETIGMPVSPRPQLTFEAPGDQVVQGSRLAAFSDGSLAVAYLDSTLDGPQQGLARIMVATSADGGRTFAEPVVAAVFKEIGAQPETAFFRWWDGAFPGIAATADDNLVIVVASRASGNPSDESDILIAHSPDRGATWAPPIAGESRISGSDFFPALSAAGDGTVLAGWLTLGQAPAGAGYDLNLTASNDGGITWTDINGSGPGSGETVPNALLGFPGGLYLGGRIAIATTDDGSFAAWPEPRDPNANPPGQQIAVRLVPAG